MYTIHDIEKMTEEQKAAVKKQAVRNFATFVAIKVGIALTIHYSVKALGKKLNKKDGN